MAQTRSLKVYNGSDSTPITDVTDRTDWPGTELSGLANLGDAAAGTWLMRDEGGTIPDLVGAGELLDAHNVIIATVGSNTLFRGRIATEDHFRGRQKAGRAKEISYTLEDQNSHLRGIVVHDWVRPAETDAARAQGLVASYLSGSPRATTNLNGSNLIILSSNLISLPAKTYSGVTPYEIMQELASNADKEMFVSVDNELAYFGHDYAGYASQLRVSDALADANSTTYAPWDPHGSEFGRQKLSALRVYYGSDVTQSTIRLTNSNAPRFDYWEDIFWDSESTTAAQAEARAQKMLDYRSTDDTNYTCTIGPLTGDEIYKIKPGHSIQFKSRAARGGRLANGTYLGDSFFTTRVRQISWTMPNEDQYLARLELERPKRTSPPGNSGDKGSQALATALQLCHGTESSCTDDFLRVSDDDWGLSPIKCLTWQTHAGFLPANEATDSSIVGSVGIQNSDGVDVHNDYLPLDGWDGTPPEFLVKTRFTTGVAFLIQKAGGFVGRGGIGIDAQYTSFRWKLSIDGSGNVDAEVEAVDAANTYVSAFSNLGPPLLTGATGVWLWARCAIDDHSIYLTIWKDGDADPGSPNLQVTWDGNPVEPHFLDATLGIPTCDLFQVYTGDDAIGAPDGLAGTVELDSLEITAGNDCGTIGICDVCGLTGGPARTPGTSNDAAPINHSHDSVDNGSTAGGDLSGTYPNPTFQKIQTRSLLNNSGLNIVLGDVVVQDSSANDAFTINTTTNFSNGWLGVAQAAIGSNTLGPVLLSGYTSLINVGSNSTTRGRFLFGSNMARRAYGSATRTTGAFGQVLTTSALPDAIIWSTTDGSGGGGGSGPFEDAGAPNWKFVSGATTLEDETETVSVELDVNQIILLGGAAGVFIENGKFQVYGDYGLVIPTASSEPSGGNSEDGQEYYNGTTERFRARQNGVWVDAVRGALTSRTSAVAIANTETVVTNFSMPAGFMEAGTTFRIKAYGRLTSGATGGSSIFRCRIGTTTLTGNIPATLTVANGALVTNAPFTVEMLVTVRTAGSGGTAIGNIEALGGVIGAFTVAGAISAISATVVVDTTATKLIEFTYISGNAGTTATFENVVIELLQ